MSNEEAKILGATKWGKMRSEGIGIYKVAKKGSAIKASACRGWSDSLGKRNRECGYECKVATIYRRKKKSYSGVEN